MTTGIMDALRGNGRKSRSEPPAKAVAAEPVDTRARLLDALTEGTPEAVEAAVMERLMRPWLVISQLYKRTKRDAEMWRRRGAWIEQAYEDAASAYRAAEERFNAARRDVEQYSDPSLSWKKRAMLEEAAIPADLRKALDTAEARSRGSARYVHQSVQLVENIRLALERRLDDDESGCDAICREVEALSGAASGYWERIVSEERAAGREIVLPAID